MGQVARRSLSGRSPGSEGYAGEYVSNGDHGFLVKEHLTPGFMKSGVHVFFGEEGDVF